MQNDETKYDDLIKKINLLQASLKNLKNQLNSVYTICDTYLAEDINNEFKDIKNDR
tara:strand:- start:1098 stop:1265 length:168 start_codon:yes stop_codon:yes gene_type:complete